MKDYPYQNYNQIHLICFFGGWGPREQGRLENEDSDIWWGGMLYNSTGQFIYLF